MRGPGIFIRMKTPFKSLLAFWCIAVSGVTLRADEAPTPGTIAGASYQLLDLDLGGTTRTDKWLAMNQYNYTPVYYGYGSSPLIGSAWQYAMRPNFPSENSTATFNKRVLYREDGTDYQPNGYPAQEGIYTLFTRTPFTVTESSALEGLQTVAFQIYLTTGGSDAGEVYGVDGDLYILPTLTVYLADATSLTFSATYSELYESNPVEFDHSGGDVEETFDIYENYRLYVWDLSSVVGTILSFEIDFAAYEHVSLRSIQLDQSTVAIPEPAVVACIISLCGFLFTLRRRGRRQA